MKHIPRPRRIGIYAGAFDPVHAGHVGFALQALQAAHLDEVVFLPERMPRHKPGVEHFAHRVAMLKKAAEPYKAMSVMELVDRHFTVRRTLPALKTAFPDSQLVLLAGSDTALSMPDWAQVRQLMEAVELVVGVRGGHEKDTVIETIESWQHQPLALTVIESVAPDISSSKIRQALRTNKYAKGLLLSVRRYSSREWLYVSLVHAIKNS